MEITFKIDPSYASPDQVVRLITAMQGLAAAMGGTVAGGGAVGVGTVGSSASSGGVALCAEIPAKRVQQMLNTVFGSFEAQVSAAAPRLPSDAAIAKTSQNIDAAALSCTGPEEQRLFEMGIFQRVCSHAFSPVTSDSVLAWIEICSRIGIEALHETIRNQLTQRVLKTMTNPKKAMVASGADQSKIFLQPAICFAAMIKFSMIKMDGTCDTIAALLQADKTAAQAVLVLTEALRLCPDAFYRRASDEKINKLLGALTCTAATRVRGANDVHTQVGAGGGACGRKGRARAPASHFLIEQPSRSAPSLAHDKPPSNPLHSLLTSAHQRADERKWPPRPSRGWWCTRRRCYGRRGLCGVRRLEAAHAPPHLVVRAREANPRPDRPRRPALYVRRGRHRVCVGHSAPKLDLRGEESFG